MLEPSLLDKPGVQFDLVTNKNFLVRGEVREHRAFFIHLTWVKGWSASVCREMLQAMYDIRKAAKMNGFDTVYALFPDQKKVEKLALMMGFDYELIFTKHSGEQIILMSQSVEGVS